MTRKVSRIERVGDGLKVTMADGSSATYINAAQVPDGIARLLSRMDSAPGAPQGVGDGHGDGGQGGAEAARAAYRARLEQAHQLGLADAHHGLTGRQLYEARLRGGWQQGPITKTKPGGHKQWKGA